MKRLFLIVLLGTKGLVLPAEEMQSEPPPRSTAQLKSDAVGLRAKVERHFVLMGEFGNDPALQASVKELSAAGSPVLRIVQDAYNQWSRGETADTRYGVRPGEMRWRAVHLLGSLGLPEAIPFLFAIAKTALPDPRSGEKPYADEYRIRLRAIAGLEKLKAVDELKQLHEIGGVLRNPTAASLYALGTNVGRVSRVDVKTALADDTADPKDYNPGKGRAPQAEKPGSAKANVKRRPDSPVVRKER